MPIEPDKDDIADALARMADGLPDKPARPAQPPRSAGEFRAPPPRPAGPEKDAPRPAAPAPAPPPGPAAKSKPARPERPRPDRPAEPPPEATPEDQADVVNIIDDGDAVIVPAPDAEVFAPKATPKVMKTSLTRSLGFRRTIIPILLTSGVLLLGIGSLKWVAGSNSLFSDMNLMFVGTLCGSGAFLLIVAVLNMLQVRADLEQGKQTASS